jgi:hypothetical protein
LSEYSISKCPWIDKNDIWLEADSFRSKYWQSSNLPVDIALIIEGSLGMDIIPVHDMKSEFDTDAFLRRDLTAICVDYNCYDEDRFENRMRFSLAHEMGHYILHRNIISSLSFSSPEEWVEIVNGIPQEEYWKFEWQANEFGGRLLVPHDKLEEGVKQIVERIVKNLSPQELKRHRSDMIRIVSPIVNNRLFGVSNDVIERRIRSEELLSYIS